MHVVVEHTPQYSALGNAYVPTTYQSTSPTLYEPVHRLEGRCGEGGGEGEEVPLQLADRRRLGRGRGERRVRLGNGNVERAVDERGVGILEVC